MRTHTIIHRCFQVSLIFVTASAFAMSDEIKKDLVQPQIIQVDKSLATMPMGLKDALRKLFKQRALDIADAGRPFRQTDVVIDAKTARLPTRRLVLAFAPPQFYYVYYRSGGYENAGNLLAFAKKNGTYKFAWGGVEFENDPSTPQEIIKRVRRKSFDDSKNFFW